MWRRIQIEWDDLASFDPPENLCAEMVKTPSARAFSDGDAYADFLDEIGLVGMGGSGFSTAEKVRASIGAHTLVINGVECEPGITIDQSILLHHHRWVIAGAKASAQAVGAKRIVLATHHNTEHHAHLKALYPGFEIVVFPNRYPSGAEKLILKKLSGRIPPPGVRPYQLGYLVQNAVSLRAIGRAIVDGIPVIERPLTLAMPSARFHRNVIAPVGQLVRDVLASFELPYDPATHFIVESGLMMGREIHPEDHVEKTTLSLIVLDRSGMEPKERPCIRCGTCNTSCPLGLHPYGLVERIQKGKTGSEAFRMQMTECFLCGVCSSVCPSDIPLVKVLQEGKRCL